MPATLIASTIIIIIVNVTIGKGTLAVELSSIIKMCVYILMIKFNAS